MRALGTTHRGFSLIEIVAASVIGALVAGGTMTAFVMTVKFSQKASSHTEATQLAQQTLERFRDRVACRQSGQTQSDTWYDTSCNADAPAGSTTDSIPASSVLPKFSGARTYKVVPADCDGDGSAGDCMKVVTKVTWTPPE